jgi:hypothetical protein
MRGAQRIPPCERGVYPAHVSLALCMPVRRAPASYQVRYLFVPRESGFELQTVWTAMLSLVSTRIRTARGEWMHRAIR